MHTSGCKPQIKVLRLDSLPEPIYDNQLQINILIRSRVLKSLNFHISTPVSYLCNALISSLGAELKIYDGDSSLQIFWAKKNFCL